MLFWVESTTRHFTPLMIDVHLHKLGSQGPYLDGLMSKKEQNEPKQETISQDDTNIIIDAEIIEPEPVVEETKASSGSSLNIALAVALVALVAVAGAAGFGVYSWNGLQGSLETMRGDIVKANESQATLSQQLAKTTAVSEGQAKALSEQKVIFAQQDEKLSQERVLLKEQGGELSRTLEKLYQRVGRNSTAWMASEAEYLLRVANHRLFLERDVVTATKALEIADGRLRDTGDPGWIEVRKLIADEVAALKSMGQLDQVGLSAALSGLIKQVKGLEMTGLQYTPERPSEPEFTSPEERSIDTLLSDGWNGFKSVMVIRHRDKPVTAMLAPEQQFFVYQNIELQLEAARLAMLRGDQVLFDNSLKMAAQWVGDFFDNEANATAALVEEINKIQKTDVNPSLPDISKSLMALTERMQASKGESAK